MIFALFLSTFSFAADLCSTSQVAKVQQRISVPDDIGYFMKAAPGTREVGFATVSGNRLLDLRSGKFRNVEGMVDPVLSPDGKMVTVPQHMIFDPGTKTYRPAAGRKSPGLNISLRGVGEFVERCDAAGKCQFEDLEPEQVRKGKEPFRAPFMNFYVRGKDGDLKHALSDAEVTENYQSIGILAKTPISSTYRMLYEGADGLRLREYARDERSGKVTVTAKTKLVCPGLTDALPSLSKNGDELSAYDAKHGVTNIYRIGRNGRGCEKVDTIPALVGKVDFSPNGKRLAFHIDEAADTKMFLRPEKRNKLGVNLYDRETKTLIPIATPENENSYYPVFVSDLEIAYVSATMPVAPERQKFFVNLTQIYPPEASSCKDCYDANSRKGQLAALIGAIRLGKCESEQKPRFKNSVLSFSRMPRAACASVAASCDEACLAGELTRIKGTLRRSGFSIGGVSLAAPEAWNAEELSKVTSSDLMAFCQELRPQSSSGESETAADGDTTPAN